MGIRLHPARAIAVLAILVVVLTSLACSMRVYTRGTEGLGPHRDLTSGATVAVLPDAAVKLDEGTTAKIESLLADEGYELTAPCEADFLVLAHYDMTSTRQNRTLEPLTGPTSGIRSAPKHGPYDHTVHLRIVEAKPYLADGELRLVWAGAAMVADAPTAGARFMRMAAICVVDEIGHESQETVMTKMRADDPRVRRED